MRKRKMAEKRKAIGTVFVLQPDYLVNWAPTRLLGERFRGFDFLVIRHLDTFKSQLQMFVESGIAPAALVMDAVLFNSVSNAKLGMPFAKTALEHWKTISYLREVPIIVWSLFPVGKVQEFIGKFDNRTHYAYMGNESKDLIARFSELFE